MPATQLNNLTILKEIRQELRNEPTHAEAILWQYLKGSQLAERKFRRQHSVGYFVLDFYCPSERLAIELDGGVHDNQEQQDYDNERTMALETLDLTVIRFRNEMIFDNIDVVLNTILTHFNT
jgi:very-short-patch-repair endonuclease